MVVKVRQYADSERFADEVGEFLLAHETEHSLSLGILSTLREPDGPYADAQPYLAAVYDEAGVVALVAIRTPPRSLVLSRAASPAAIVPCVHDVWRTIPDLPGVVGPAESVSAFTKRWEAVTGTRSTLHMSMRAFRAEHVIEPRGIAGSARPAGPGDRSTVGQWLTAFTGEALGEEPDADRIGRTAEGLAPTSAHRGVWLWEVDDRPVSMAGYAGPTPNGIRVSAVYTPPEWRGRGYATACVAALTRRLLDGGRRFCFLFTDLANPTSNALYERVGYRPIADMESRTFEPCDGDGPEG